MAKRTKSQLMVSTWQDDLKYAIRSHNELESFFEQEFPQTPYSVLIPRPLAQKIKDTGIDGPLGKQYLPNTLENDKSGAFDPIGDGLKHVAPQLIHRYKNRALFLPTPNCPVACRFCFRKNEIQAKDSIFKQEFAQTLNYLKRHSEIDEIIFSGGDPLILSDSKLEFYLNSFSQISSIKFIRFHTRTPLILPNRFTSSFEKMILTMAGRFSDIITVIHVNHPIELNDQVTHALLKLKRVTPTLLSQSVLLKGINDDTSTLKDLFYQLTSIQVRPYYLHHPDPVLGANHFTLATQKGRQITSQLRANLSGHAIPHYVIDSSNAHGKRLVERQQNSSFPQGALTRP